MPDYGKVTEKRRGSSYASLKQWLQLKKYQYEVTFSLYMLTPTEKFIFNLILFLLVSLLVTAATLYLPSHIGVIYHRMSYYVHGEDADNMAVSPSGETVSSLAKEGLRITSEAIKSGATPMSRAVKEL